MKLRRLTAVLLAGMMTMCALNGCGAAEQTTEELQSVTVFAASSMTDCMGELVEAYGEAAPDIEIFTNFASSGDLQSQIENGAPCDLFISAAQKQMDTLEEEQLIAHDSRINLLSNQAVLIVPATADSNGVTTYEQLAEDSVQRVAIGDPASVPAGQYAQEILTALGIWDAVSEKAVLGESVRQVLAWCEAGEVDAGIVYATDAWTSDGVQIVSQTPPNSCEPIIYPAALTADGAENQAAVDFLAFLQSEKAREVFHSYGFYDAE